MTDTIRTFYPRLASLPEIVSLISTSFPDDEAAILQRMRAGLDLGDDRDELEETLTNFIIDHAEKISSYEGLGTTPDSSNEAITYFEMHNPDVANLLKRQAAELKKLLGKDGAAIALGQAREPFTISILCWRSIHIVTADEFENAWFGNEESAADFAKSNYQPFIDGYKV